MKLSYSIQSKLRELAINLFVAGYKKKFQEFFSFTSPSLSMVIIGHHKENRVITQQCNKTIATREYYHYLDR
ncbi:hypothetical protein DERF_001383 [Dermatophagoides farinae]|uniref:Uncharacterized protein n=1 Tax=Dermatophagoides farinae TaxID=6954 RepID=A0A922L9K7_DERFA|nr:hypothetical protein DERF_001383 [Dermatophagoides farinae]